MDNFKIEENDIIEEIEQPYVYPKIEEFREKTDIAIADLINLKKEISNLIDERINELCRLYEQIEDYQNKIEKSFFMEENPEMCF